MDHNTYIPKLAKIIEIKEEVGGARPIKTFRTQFLNMNDFSFRSGQCAMLSVFGRGESMISISSSPLMKDYLQFSILKMGRVTSSLHEMQVGDVIGIRGPYGNNFPVEDWKGKNIIFIGGGIGLAPIWSVLNTALGKKGDYGDLMLIYGARTSKDLVFKEELEELKKKMSVHLSIDVEEPDWKEFVGFVPQNVTDKKPSAKNAIAVTCGPPIMIKFVIKALEELGFKDEQIYTTVENKMKCGIGKCGRCNIGFHYVCKDGPVYSWAELKKLPQEY
jgi:sulfhydrogenase subunit gamma (sulfur reductase)